MLNFHRFTIDHIDNYEKKIEKNVVFLNVVCRTSTLLQNHILFWFDNWRRKRRKIILADKWM